ncbi:MAG: endonuclease Q family protein [Candidatus Pacebacteria bacterium]|nr:endonuclease Q family protein [Candidatus Paceibacterota bacterium]
MKFIADFHIHSKYSRATSKNMDLKGLDEGARIKGVNVMGTGDFTHPQWLDYLKNNLVPAEEGLFKLKKEEKGTRFILTSEISCIYSQDNRVRKIHIIVLAPSFDVVDKINGRLAEIGNLKADGRPILGLGAKDLAKIIFDSSQDCMAIPAHCMTPWFGIFGSKSGFTSVKECFGEYAEYIYALETGLSADPLTLWRIPDGRRLALISNSDAHSPRKIGREANVFDTEVSYSSIIEAIKTKDPKKFLYTIEFYPEEGKYHFDGHRNCEVRLSPQETEKYGGTCPVCGKPLTVGVLNRAEKLSDKKEGFIPEGAIPFRSLVPLEEIVADALAQNIGTKEVLKQHNNLIEKLGSEFNILLNVTEQDLAAATLPEITEGIIRVREGKVQKEPGYDGVYGKISIFSKGIVPNKPKQKTLF